MSNPESSLASLSSEQRRALLAKLLQQRAQKPTRASAQTLSYGQRSLWFLQQLAPQSVAYNITFAARIVSALDSGFLKRVFQTLVDRHVSLRTTFAIDEGQPVLKIHERQQIFFREVEAQSWSEEQLHEQLDQHTHETFELETAPLVRLYLFHRTEKEHILLWVMHHTMGDFWSFMVMLNEIGALYSAGSENQSLVLPPVDYSYIDYIKWQEELLSGAEGERLKAYWHRKLAGELPVLALPIDLPRPPLQTYEGACFSIPLDADLTRRVRDLARQETTTLYVVLLAAFNVLLHRYTGQDDILVGSPMAGRTKTEFESVVGYFVNPICLRNDLSGGPSFRGLVRKVTETVREALRHQDYPTVLLAEQLSTSRDASRSHLFQVLFNLNRPHSLDGDPLTISGGDQITTRLDVGGLVIETMDLEQRSAMFDLTLTVNDLGERLLASFQYNTDLFKPETIERMAENFRILLHHTLSHPEQSIDIVALMGEAEQQQVTRQFSGRAIARPEKTDVHLLIEQQAGKQPDAVAVVDGSRRLSYRQLNERANQLARHLIAQGVGANTVVGICLERSIEAVVSVLAVMKAGGAYTAMSPAFPSARIALLMKQTAAPLLLTKQTIAAELHDVPGRIIALDAIESEIKKHPADDLYARATLDDLSYIVFTSGSTGQPKGTLITRANLANFYQAAELAYNLKGQVHSHLQMAAFPFDVFSGDLTRALCSGGRLVICSQDTMLTPADLFALLRREEIDIAEFVPVVLRGLIAYIKERHESLSFLQILIAGSDAWYVDEYRQIRELCGPETRIINSYGTAETTIDSTYFEGASDSLPIEGLVPIGIPFAGSDLYVLDAHLQAVPIGVSGEICIGGEGLARGYLNLPEKTAERFVDIIINGITSRIYRTGDIGRFRPDGNLQLLGRIDEQVKIRGNRVEPGEVESVLATHAQVKDVAVVARDFNAGDKRLVAYVVGNPGVNLVVTELREFLRAQLPDYMIPAVFIKMERLPVSSNGKVDRKSLPQPESADTDSETAVGPRNPLEVTLTEIWSAVLKRDRTGIHDNFFDLGGHSLLSTQLVSRIRDRCHIEVPLRMIFECPTVAALAERLQRNGLAATEQGAVAGNQKSEREEIEL